jgi:hypothetical protein
VWCTRPTLDFKSITFGRASLEDVRHLDHRAGNPQFWHLPKVQVVGFDIDSVRQYYKLPGWPNGFAVIDLGDRTVDCLSNPELDLVWPERDLDEYVQEARRAMCRLART